MRPYLVPGIVLAGVAVLAVSMILYSVRSPEIETFLPTPPHAVEVGDALVGPAVYTADASASDEWIFFDFSRGSVVHAPGPLDWDLAFQRFRVIANGGPGFAGAGGIIELGDVPFESVSTVPAEGYVGTEVRSDSTNAAIERWYEYSWMSHILRPKPIVYAIRTADGRYGKLQIRGYYCPGALPGCMTFRYVYQGGGGSTFTATEPLRD